MLKKTIITLVALACTSNSNAEVVVQKTPLQLKHKTKSEVRAFVAPSQGPRALFANGEMALHAAKLMQIDFDPNKDSIVMSGPEVYQLIERMITRGQITNGWTDSQELESLFIDLLHQEAQKIEAHDKRHIAAQEQSLNLILAAAI